MTSINLVFPHQLFQESPLFKDTAPFYLVEEFLFFKQYKFHQQKIAFHRASMKQYADYLRSIGKEVVYVEAIESISDIRQLLPHLHQQGITHIAYIDPTDDWLEKRIQKQVTLLELSFTKYDSPLFLNTPSDLASFFKPSKKKFFQTKFYIGERQKRHILLDEAGKAQGGKWSYDAANRKKYPKKKIPPAITFPATDSYWEEAVQYVKQHFNQHYGQVSSTPLYPTNYESSQQWLEQFFDFRFAEFGPYEDAIVAQQSILHHSVLTPMLNVGLLLPQDIIDQALEYAQQNDIPINSTEGFVRQIIGWREFIRGVYECKGVQERTTNFWGFDRKIPASFYDGTTGILPIDQSIKKVLRTGYCHHIERLMVLGNFMVLCEFDPDEVYRWFMELFIDAYDWVMVPNVYGMSQFADGGLMSTKPYISGSNYLMKMSDFAKGDWQQIWDALFWRFMHVNRDFFLKNPRLGMLVHMYDKMEVNKQQRIMETADDFLSKL